MLHLKKFNEKFFGGDMEADKADLPQLENETGLSNDEINKASNIVDQISQVSKRVKMFGGVKNHTKPKVLELIKIINNNKDIINKILNQ